MECAMHTTNLRNVRGSIMLAAPRAILKVRRLTVDTTVGVSLSGDRLVVEPKPKARYRLAELLAASDYSRPQPPSEREWVGVSPVGREPI
jgi:antitoxin ChpS